jgi:large subunit ribosomal protein L30
MRQLKITQIKSVIGCDENQRRVIKGLGLGKIRREVIKPDTAIIRGMVTKVSHLVSVSINEVRS